jgi:hypothetical protein
MRGKRRLAEEMPMQPIAGARERRATVQPGPAEQVERDPAVDNFAGLARRAAAAGIEAKNHAVANVEVTDLRAHLTTTPAPSWASTPGSGNGVACEPTLRSVWHMPTATILTRSSPERGSPISTSSIWNGASGDSITAAVIFTRVLSLMARTTQRSARRSCPCGDRESKGCALVRGASECLALTGLRLFQAVAERPLAVHGLASQVNERMDVLRCRQDRRKAVAGQLPTALGLMQHKQLVIATRDLSASGEDSDGAV